MRKIDIEFVGIKELAVIFGCHPMTIRRAIKKGYISAIRIGEGKKSPYRISKKTVESIHTNLLISNLKNRSNKN